MSHPFLETIEYPWHRPDAIAFHSVLSKAVKEPDQIGFIYVKCGEDLPQLTPGKPGNLVWREVLQNLTASGNLKELIDQLKQQFPTSQPIQKAIQDVLDAQPSHGVKVANAFTALGQMLQEDVALRDAVNRFKQTFEGELARIAVVNFYKSLHDQLHILQIKCYDLIINELSAPDFKGPQESILQYIEHFRTIVEKLKSIAGQMTIETYDISWITELGQAQLLMAIGASPDGFDLEQINRAAQDTNNILSVHPGNINQRLMGAVDALSLRSLKEALANVSQQLARFNLDQEKVREFNAGIDSLDSLNKRLLSLSKEHNPWQDADRVLRRIDQQMEKGISELEDSWPQLQQKIAKIFGQSAEEWAVRLRIQSDKLDKVLKAEPKDVKQITQSFITYREQAVQRFFSVDTLLLSLCAELNEMGRRLTPLLEKM